MKDLDYLFLLNLPIPIQLENYELIHLKTPSIEDYHTHAGYQMLHSFFQIDVKNVGQDPQSFGFLFDTYLDFLVGLKMKSIASNEAWKDMFVIFEEITGTVMEPNGLEHNGVPLTEKDVLKIRQAYLISVGSLDINGNSTKEDQEEDEFEKKLKERQARIAKLKGETLEKGRKVNFLQMVNYITYELGMSPQDIKKLNFFGVVENFNLAQKASQDKILKMAASAGHLKEYKDILSI